MERAVTSQYDHTPNLLNLHAPLNPPSIVERSGPASQPSVSTMQLVTTVRCAVDRIACQKAARFSPLGATASIAPSIPAMVTKNSMCRTGVAYFS